MRQCLLCGGVNGRQDVLDQFRRLIAERRPDAVFFVGGIVDPERVCTAHSTPWGIATKDSGFILKFFRTLTELGVFCAVIPAPVCAPMEEFLRIGMQAELESRHVHLAHATCIEAGDVAICGLGGHIAERPLLGIDSSSRTLARYFTRALGTAKQPRTVLLLSTPPPGRLGGIEGSPLVQELIDGYHPTLCVVGGSSMNYGVECVGRTLIVNPGNLSDGRAAWLDWNRPRTKQVEFLNLRAMGQKAELVLAL